MTRLLKTSRSSIVLTVLASLAFTAAHAQMKGNFDTADSNHDGKVTFKEYAAYARQALANADGRKAKRFNKLSADQQNALLQKRFDRADRNHHGYLDRNDWSAPQT